jgi:hypothetical protein
MTDARKVPASGETVNDGLHTARRALVRRPIGPGIEPGKGPNFTREW